MLKLIRTAMVRMLPNEPRRRGIGVVLGVKVGIETSSGK
jgi:hypothetical protein